MKTCNEQMSRMNQTVLSKRIDSLQDRVTNFKRAIRSSSSSSSRYMSEVCQQVFV